MSPALLSLLCLCGSWSNLPPLPHGFGGMFAAESEGVLLAGGGSRFPLRPLWAGGGKVFGNAVYTLSSPQGTWRELPLRLPMPVAHAASAPWRGGVLLAGGVNAFGPRREVWHVRLHNGALQVEPLVPLPHPLVFATASVAGGVLYVVGGQSPGLSMGRQCWALPLEPGRGPTVWRRMADLPGPGGILMVAGSDGEAVFIFGGLALNPLRPLADAYRLTPGLNRWEALAPLPAPRVAAASPAPRLANGSFWVAGGYEAVFPGPAQEHPGFSRATFRYQPRGNQWTPGPFLPPPRGRPPSLPGAEPVVAAPAVLWQGGVYFISGETRPSLRTPAVFGVQRFQTR